MRKRISLLLILCLILSLVSASARPAQAIPAQTGEPMFVISFCVGPEL